MNKKKRNQKKPKEKERIFFMFDMLISLTSGDKPLR